MDIFLCSPEALNLEYDGVAFRVFADLVLRMFKDLFRYTRCIYVESAMLTEKESLE